MRSPRILIVEDEALVALANAETLQIVGYEVIGVAANHEEALEAAAESRPDLVLMDIRLKGSVDGIETARVLKERYGCRIVFVTGQSDRTTWERSRIVEPSGYLKKPHTPEQLTQLVANALT